MSNEAFNKIVNLIVEWSKENDCGTVLNYQAIRDLVAWCHPFSSLTRDTIDEYLDALSTESGYLVKSADVLRAIKLFNK
jgi:hypothetical protein